MLAAYIDRIGPAWRIRIRAAGDGWTPGRDWMEARVGFRVRVWTGAGGGDGDAAERVGRKREREIGRAHV